MGTFRFFSYETEHHATGQWIQRMVRTLRTETGDNFGMGKEPLTIHKKPGSVPGTM